MYDALQKTTKIGLFILLFEEKEKYACHAQTRTKHP